jgi:hypothetical protein
MGGSVGREITHYGMVDGHRTLRGALADPTAYGAHLWHLPGATVASLEDARRMGGARDPVEARFLDDCEALVSRFPDLPSCPLDRMFARIAFVFGELAPHEPDLQRACRGGLALAGLTAGQGHPYRWMDPRTAGRCAVALGRVDADGFQDAYHRCWATMAAQGVYKAPHHASDTDVRAAGDHLWRTVVALRGFFVEVTSRRLGVLTVEG